MAEILQSLIGLWILGINDYFAVKPVHIKACLSTILVLLGICGCTEIVPIFHPDPPIPSGCAFHVSDSNLVASIYEDQDSLILILESNERIVRPLSCFKSYQVDSADWTVNLYYRDSTVQDLPFRGNTLEILEEDIIVNPYERAPLAALVRFTLPFPGSIKIDVHGITENSPVLSHSFDVVTIQHEIPVYGLYAEHQNIVTITVLDFFGNERLSRDIIIQTDTIGTIESGLMTVNMNVRSDSLSDRMFFIQNAIYDSEGYIRWFSRYRGNKYFPIANGLIAIQLYNDKGVPAPTVEDIRIMNLLGQEIELFDVPNRNHHEIVEKSPGGNLLVATNAQPYNNTDDDTEDAIVEIDRQTGEVVKTWDLRQIFDQSRPRLWTEMPNDWCHLNSIQYDSTDNTLLISSKLQYFVSKIDYDTQQIKWIFGNHENWGESWQDYLLTPLDFDTTIHMNREWVYAQHMSRLTNDGNIIVYDNGRKRPGGDFTRILEFSVDESDMTAEKTWNLDFTFSTRTMGSIHVYEDGTLLVGHGERGKVLEVTRSGEVLFDARLKTFYRAYPIWLYELP